MKATRQLNFCPVLRKDFVIDEYQIVEAKSYGADVILLIAAALSTKRCAELSRFARSLGMEVLLEIHTPNEFGHINENTSLIGINNRNLKTFEVDLDTSLNMINRLDGHVAISESGIRTPSDFKLLKQAGFKGFLMGQRFMQSVNPAAELKSFLNQVLEPQKVGV